MSEGGDKTEAPTDKRRKDAREKGDILKSRDLATALVVLAGVAWLMFFGPALLAACRGVMASSLTFDRADVEDFAPWRPLVEAGWKLAMPLGTLFAITIAAAVVSQAGLGSFGFNGSLLAPKASRINPASGLKRIIGMSGWIELGKSLLKVILLGSIGTWMVWKTAHFSFGLAASNLPVALAGLGATMTNVLLVMAMGLVAIALFDVPTQILQLLRKLRMTKQEVRDEHKESEGNPEMKGHLRAKQRAMLSGGMRQALTEAHVVLTNPTHFAVALRYDRGRDQVPVVVAKGRNATALAIREAAAEMSLPVLEYPALARAVYYTSREGQEVRDDLYVAIATVLAFVFGLNERAGGRMPPVDVPLTARFDENGKKQG
ncbi:MULTISPECIES: flagellar biosynthesis protein FlhB [unclassified Sphingomonas]|uniref:EscU/YscU/HrcU family type III secretion system export apparatus switch protein n=1 Tax=unclassified Sphingomonas TaxID=196159 RepID=UPI00160F8266|nr:MULTISPECIES: flagellar type III secretion system protein FlhB [unclassified Sphingomonas]MBB3347711.1 flagellar biosynthetic protein FlhB [Sphingomonas sp. BK069]MBB3472508.1 flagellar biosynthetic protein FlhB [Sphingomonas sp. BK345]